MLYRAPQLDIPADDPFKCDALNRKPTVEFLTKIIGNAGGPFVLALDSPWGSGKTTLIKMLMTVLIKQKHCCVYFNAWDVDYVQDPIVPLVAALEQVDLGESQAAAEFKKRMRAVRGITTIIAKRLIIGGLKAATVGVLDIDRTTEAIAADGAENTAQDVVSAYEKGRNLVDQFHRNLDVAVKQLVAAERKPPLVVFVDELDRCRPDFALMTLERIKHLFDVRDVQFVLSIDRDQLANSMKAVYGEGLNTDEYLRRFIDLDFAVPNAPQRPYVESLLGRFDLGPAFSARNHPELREDREIFLDLFTALSEALDLSLRVQERCFTRFCIVMEQTPNDHYLHPALVVALIILRSKDPGLFARLMRNEAATEEVMQLFKKTPAGFRFWRSRTGFWLEAQLLASDPDEERRERDLRNLRLLADDPEANAETKKRASEIWGMASRLGNSHVFRGARWTSLARKIELSASVRD